MSQRELDQRVAAATGESLETIRRLGFVALTPIPIERERDREPLTIDWDDFDRERLIIHPR